MCIRDRSKEMLDICSVNENMLPRLFESYEVVGTIKDDIAELLGFDRTCLLYTSI